MKYFLDTNIIIYALKDTYPAIKEHFLKVPASSIAIPSPVLAEIEYGARKSFDYEKTIATYRQFTNTFELVSFAKKATHAFGQIRAELEKQGKTIGANDLMIAAIVLAENGILVTHNTREFERITQLRIEDWTC